MTLGRINRDMSPNTPTQSVSAHTTPAHAQRDVTGQHNSSQSNQTPPSLRGVTKFAVLLMTYIFALSLLGVWRGVCSVYHRTRAVSK